MERGLLWLPLLAIFIGLAWQGRKEFQKVEGYQHWAKQFERSKYDIYAVLAQSGSNLTWGKPTPKGLIDLQSFSLKDVKSIDLIVDDRRVSLETPPGKGRAIALEFIFSSDAIVRIPFTEIPLAVDWAKYLQGLQRLQSLSG